MAGRKVFTSGEILTAADVNSYLMDQSVMVFADSSARSSAIPSPSEGMVTYVEDANRVEVYDGAAFGAIGGILQVVSTHKNDSFSAGSITDDLPTSVTGLSATITPSSTSSKIMAFVICHASTDGVGGAVFNNLAIERNGTRIGSHTSDNYWAAFSGVISSNAAGLGPVVWNYLDSPSSTSALTYQVLVGQSATGAGGTVYVNRSSGNSRFATSSITLMEVAV